MAIAAPVFFIAGLAYAAWCLVVAFDGGFQVGTLGMALLSAALCYQGLALFQERERARVPGIVSAVALAIGCSASIAVISLPWLLAPAKASIPQTLWPTLILLLLSAVAFTVAAAFLMYDRHGRPGLPMERRRDG
jgi:hypothetical protein